MMESSTFAEADRKKESPTESSFRWQAGGIHSEAAGWTVSRPCRPHRYRVRVGSTRAN